MDVIVEISYRAAPDGLWIDVHGDKEALSIRSDAERDAAREDLLEMMRPYGGRHLPLADQ